LGRSTFLQYFNVWFYCETQCAAVRVGDFDGKGFIDACCKGAASKKWEAIEVRDCRGGSINAGDAGLKKYDAQCYLIEEKMPESKLKISLRIGRQGKFHR
jgi:hypothetical protein